MEERFWSHFNAQVIALCVVLRTLRPVSGDA